MEALKPTLMEYNFEGYKEYSHMTKLQLTILAYSLEESLAKAIEQAKNEAAKYSDDSRSNLAFEVGHLSGSIKSCLSQLQHQKK